VFNSTTSNAFASLDIGGVSTLFTISLTSGAAAAIGTIGTGATPVLDIALPICAQINVGVCQPFYSVPVYGLTAQNSLVRFLSTDTGAILQTTALAPLSAGENLIGMDFRPINGLLYTISTLNKLYSVDVQTGTLTYVNQTSLPLNGTSFGFDFNPSVDLIRIVSDFGQNVRVSPNSGAVTVDSDINGLAMGVISSAAYANNVPAAASTTLYTLSATTLFTQNPPNAGTQVPVGPLLVMTNITTGFDIATNNSVNYGFMSAPIAGVFRLLTVNLATGECLIRGIIGQTPISILDIAIPIQSPIPVTATTNNVQPTSNPVVTSAQTQSTAAPVPTPVTTPMGSAGKNSFVLLSLLVVLWITV